MDAEETGIQRHQLIQSNESSPSSFMDLLLNSSPSASTLTSSSITSVPSSISSHVVSTCSVPSPVNVTDTVPMPRVFSVPSPTPVSYPIPPLNNHLAAAYPQYISNPYTHGLPYNTFAVSSGFPAYGPYVQQPHSSRFVPLAPKPPNDQASKAAPSHGPLNFIESVRQIRCQLYTMAGIDKSDEPPTEGSPVYSTWRKSVIEAWRPYSMTHYLMVAKLSNRCFALVEKIAESLEKKVTQSDFLDLYKKPEENQYDLLLDLLEGRRTFEGLKKSRRGGKDQSAKMKEAGDYKEIAEELSRLKQRNADLTMKLEQVIEDRDKERKKASDLMLRLRRLEKESQEEYNQYRTDVDKLITEKNMLSESLTSTEYSDFDEEELAPLEIIEDRFTEKRKKGGSYIKRGQYPSKAAKSQESRLPNNNSSDDSAAEVLYESNVHLDNVISSGSSDGDNDPLSKISKKEYSRNLLAKSTRVKTKTTSKVVDDAGTDLTSNEESGDSDTSSVSKHFRDQIITNAEKARKEHQAIKEQVVEKKSSSKPKKKSAPHHAKEQSVEMDPEFQDEWDYDVRNLKETQWVAVAYDHEWFIGQVMKIMEGKVCINFLIEKNEFYYWPQIPDKAIVNPKFIFKPTVKVVEVGRKFKVHDTASILKAFEGFSKKYF